MKRFAAAVLLTSTMAVAGQTAAPDASRKQILQNPRVTVAEQQISPHTAVVADKHERDLLTVVVGKRTKSNLAPGAVFYSPAGKAERTRYEGESPMPAIIVEFASPQGRVESKHPAPSRYCNPGSRTACVNEKYLLCTAKFCVEEVTMGPGAVTTKHSHDTDHMLIAITDYSLADDVAGKDLTMRNVKSGGVEYIPAGITHTLTNKSAGEVRFVVIVFR